MELGREEVDLSERMEAFQILISTCRSKVDFRFIKISVDNLNQRAGWTRGSVFGFVSGCDSSSSKRGLITRFLLSYYSPNGIDCLILCFISLLCESVYLTVLNSDMQNLFPSEFPLRCQDSVIINFFSAET